MQTAVTAPELPALAPKAFPSSTAADCATASRAEQAVVGDAPLPDLHALVDLSHPLSLAEVVEAIETVLRHPSAPSLPKMDVVRDILMCV